MPGMYKYSMEIESNVKKLLLDTKELQDRMDTLEGKEYKINLNIDEKKLGNVISNLEKMLDSLGKGTGDFKQFENLSKELSSIVSEVQSLSKAFGKVDDSGTKTLLSSIQNIDKSLSELSQNILNVNKNMSNMGDNTSGAVKQVENISDAYQNAAKEAEKLADAQSKIGQKTNISSRDSSATSAVEQQKKDTSDIIKLTDNYGRELDEANSKLLKGTALLDEQGKLIRLYHGSDTEFDKFDLSRSNNQNNQIYGKGAYLIESEKGAEGYGSVVTQWYANVRKVMNEEGQLTLEEAQKLYNEFGKRLLNIFGKQMDFNEFFDAYIKFNPEETTVVEKMKSLANHLGKDIGDLFQTIGYDAIKMDRSNGSFYTIFDPDRLIRFKEAAVETTSAVEKLGASASQNPTKDAFPNADAKPETEGMKQVEEAIHNAVQAKKDFATANEGVQSSIDDSENPLKLEAELMGQIAKSAREAADAKKEFVEANKQVKNSADGSNSENKKKDKYAKRRKISEEDFLNFSPSRVNENLSNSGYTILGETVNTELVDGLVKVSAKIKDVDGVWKSFSAKVDADGNIFEQRFKTVTNGVDKLETALKNFGRETSPALTYQETLDKAQKIKNSLNLGDEYSIKVDSSEFVTITKKLTDVENTGASVTQTFKSAQDAIDNFGKSASNSAERTSVALKSVKSNIKEVTDESEKLANAQKEQNVNANLNKYDKQLDSYNGKVDKYQATIARFNDGGWTSDEYLDNVQAVKDAVKKYEDLLNNIRAKGGITSEEDIQNLKEYESEIKNTIATVTNMSAAEKGYNFVSGQKELDKIHKLLNENSKMSSEAKAKIKAYYTEIESGNPSMSLDRIHGEIMKIYNAEVEAGRAGRSFFDTLKNSGFHQLAAQMSGMFGFYDVINLIKQAASAVTELNTQITELAKVSEDSVSQIYADFDSYANIAKEMGSTISDTIAATTAWSKNGYNIPDSKELAEVSLLYKNVGDGINIDEANESLVSTLKGFKLEADQAEHIVDVFNEVSNREPISSSGIGEALQRSAASFNAANTSLEKSVALVTATNSVLQDPEKVGNMWKTVSARIRGAKTELEEAGEDTDGMVESTSKLQALIKGMTGFDIMESDGKTFKDIYDIIIGIGEKWQDLNDVDRASLLEKLAGKNQSNALAAAISQVDVLKKAYGEATNAEGSAREENSKYQQSVQYSIDQTKAKLEELANDTLNSNFLKGLINAGGKIIDILDIIIKNVGILKPLLAGLAIKNIVQNFD
jgi:TP901 family phage tail tape measure protein